MKQIKEPDTNLFGEIVKIKKVRTYPEFELQKAVCKYIGIKYPKVFFSSDTIAFVELSKAQQIRNFLIQKHGFKTPDLLIHEPVGRFHSCYIEIKVNSPFKVKHEELLKDEQIQEQENSLAELRKKGFVAEFGVGYNHCLHIIENYLQGNNIDLSYLSYRQKK